VTPVDGSVSPCLGITIAPQDVARVAALAAAATSGVPEVSAVLRGVGAVSQVLDWGSHVTGKQPSAQLSLSFDGDTHELSGVSARVGLRGAGAPSVLWGGIARAWVWEPEAQVARLGCMRFDYATTHLPVVPHGYSVTGAFEVVTADGKVAAGAFTELDLALVGKGASRPVKRLEFETGGATFCGVWVNLAK